ncbi:DUF3742 family protein [Pseudomonas sp. Pseusp122]|uniref:DUF3742 family protein n=1 Tax=unclassified Pseudomonas TaxID=196821 RepID=UPI0039A57739
MATHTVSSENFAMRLGQSLGRGVGGVLRAERAVWSAISRAGAPSLIVAPVKWLARAVVVVGGTVLAAWGLLYVLAVVAMVAIVVGMMTNPATDRIAQNALMPDVELPYGTESDVFGRTKGWFESDNKYQ